MSDVISDASGVSAEPDVLSCDSGGMPDLFEYVPHHHLQERREAGPPPTTDTVAKMVQGAGLLGRINAKVGLGITVIVGTMWCAYLFTVLALISAPSAFKTGDKLTIVSWIAQTFLQLVLLPIIIVGQNVQGKASDARSLATYNDATTILDEARQIQLHLQAQDELITKIQGHLETQDAAISKILSQLGAAK